MGSTCILTPEQISGAIAFHGHFCPGLAIGMRAAEWCLRELGRSGDEDIVVVVETDMCGVDAIQYLTGCTFGKGNFIFRDTGKIVFTFYRREDDIRGRLVLNPDFVMDSDSREARIELIMQADLTALFLVTRPEGPIPHRARIHKTIRCEVCGEGVMEARIARVNDKRVCIDCEATICQRLSGRPEVQS